MKTAISKTAFLIVLIAVLFSCVQPTHRKTITFKLDIKSFENISNVGIRGSAPLSWDKTLFLTDADNDSIYETTIELKSASYGLEFKFVSNDNEFELKSLNNRSIKFEFKPENIVYKAEYNNPNAKVYRTD